MKQSQEALDTYESYSKLLGLEVGDLVEITHGINSYTMGWENSWEPEMNENIGKQYVVRNISGGSGVGLVGIHNHFPVYSLKIIKKQPAFKTLKLTSEYNANIFPDRIEVGCQTITKTTFKQLVEFAKEQKLID